jgi:uncharacterized membrane protein
MRSRILALPPIGLLLAAVVWTLLEYERFPDQYPMHYNALGQPDRWAAKSLGTVLLLPGLGVGITAMIAALVWFSFQKHNARAQRSRNMLSGMNWGIAFLFLFLTLRPVYFPQVQGPWMVPAFLAVSLLPLAAYWLPVSAPTEPLPKGWRGGIYFNRENPEIWVDDPDGAGGTFNLAHPFSWVVLVLLILLPLLPLLLHKLN